MEPEENRSTYSSRRAKASELLSGGRSASRGGSAKWIAEYGSPSIASNRRSISGYIADQHKMYISMGTFGSTTKGLSAILPTGYSKSLYYARSRTPEPTKGLKEEVLKTLEIVAKYPFGMAIRMSVRMVIWYLSGMMALEVG